MHHASDIVILAITRHTIIGVGYAISVIPKEIEKKLKTDIILAITLRNTEQTQIEIEKVCVGWNSWCLMILHRIPTADAT